MATERFQDIVHAALKENILGGVLPEGLVLGEFEVARFFGIGRTPARAALLRLAEESLLRPLAPRGFVVSQGDAPVRPVRMSLEEAGATIPDHAARGLKHRNLRKRLYPEMERQVASSLVYGCFQIAEQDVAEHYGVSRTVARELLARLDRVGLVEQQDNGRWYAGPLSEQKLRDHYEMRLLLEPVALRAAAPGFRPEQIAPMLARLEAARGHAHGLGSDEAHRLEADLHFDLVLACPNPEMRRVIYRNQLPVITAHYSFQRTRHQRGDEQILGEHAAILRALLEGKADQAATGLRTHLEHGLATTLERYSAYGGAGHERVPPYMKERRSGT